MEPLKRRGQRWGQRPASFTHGRTLDLECKFWSLSTSAWGLFVCFLNINTFIVFSPFLAFFASEKIKALCVQTMLLCCPITKHQSTGCQNGLLWGKGPTTLRTRPYPHPHQPAAVRVAWWEPRSSLRSSPAAQPPATWTQLVRGRRTSLTATHTYSLEAANPISPGGTRRSLSAQSDWVKSYSRFPQRLHFPSVSFALNKARESSGGHL